MKLKNIISAIVMVMTIAFGSKAQISFEKRAGGPIGSAPKIGTFAGGMGLDNVEYSTGTVNVNIPLFEIIAHDIKVPISISYSAIGLKVGQEAGPTGMGWELNAGGRITKQVNGLDDDTNTSNTIKSTSPFTLDPNYNLTDRYNLEQVLLGKYDYAYDVYTYTLPNGGGRFTRNGLTFPFNPTFKYSDSFGRQINTGDGLVNDFIEADRIMVSKRKFYKPKNDGTPNMEPTTQQEEWTLDVKTYTTDYVLNSIVSPRYKDTVKFDYETKNAPGEYSGIFGKTRITTTETLPLNQDRGFNVGTNQWYDITGPYYYVGEPTIAQTKVEVMRHMRVKDIFYATGRVKFVYRTNDVLGRDAIDSVLVYQKVGSAYKYLKRYKFNYDPDMQYGHYLQSIDVIDAAGIKSAKWKFTYHGPYGKLPVVPLSESKAQDRWGFYNGETGNKTLLEPADSLISLRDIPHLPACDPNYPGTPANFFRYHRSENRGYYNPDYPLLDQEQLANRQYNFTEAIRGTLQSVTTPTGQKFNYEYEPNKYRVDPYPGPYHKVYPGGGIRIKSILRHDNIMFSGQTISKKNYTYGVGNYQNQGDTESGYGIVNYPGVVNSVDYSYAMGTSTQLLEMLQVLSHPLNDLSLHKGSYAYYPSVTESVMDGPNISHQTVYYFSSSNVETGPWNNFTYTGNIREQNFPEFYINQGIRRDRPGGMPSHVLEYAYTRQSGVKVRETANAYTNFDAPLTSPKLYSWFGGVKGLLIGEYSIGFYVCASTLYDNRYTWNCANVATVISMDPTGYKFLGPESGGNYYPGKYYGTTLELSEYSNVYKQTSSTVKTYDLAGVHAMDVGTKYYYDNISHMLTSRINTLNSAGDSTSTVIRYPQDFYDHELSGVALLKEANMLTEQVSGLTMVKKSGAYQITNAIKNTYKYENGLVVNDKSYRLNKEGKLFPYGSYNIGDADFKLESSYDLYDALGNLTLFSNTNSPNTALFWGYNQQYPVAQVSNVPNIYDAAYSNFESADKGSLIYSGVPVLDATSPSADYVYPLSGGSITKTTYTSGKKYIIAYWYKAGSSVIVSGGTVSAEVIKNTKGNWTFAEREITVSGTITISGTGYIDELRFYPAESLMNTFTYSPGIGITGSLDAKGQSAVYVYDNEQRLKYIKDQQGNIVKAYDYNIGTVNKQ